MPTLQQTDSPFRRDSASLCDSDAFAHADVAKVLVGAIQEAPSPFTIGLFGGWGTGKSTVLESVAARLAAVESTAYVAFDVWKYEGDSLRRQFIREVARQLKADDGALKRGFRVGRYLELFDTDVTSSRARFQFDWRQIVKAAFNAAVAGGAVYLFLYALHEYGVGGDKTLAPKLGAIAAALAFVYRALAAVLVVGQEQLARRRLEDADRFESSFKDLLGKIRERDTVVVGIDNLDRCSPDRVLELLATIKTFLEPVAESEKRFVFLIAADDAALRRHLIAKELEISGAGAAAAHAGGKIPEDVAAAVDEYLRKYFTAVLRLPPALTEHLEEFAEEQLSDLFAAWDVDQHSRKRLVLLVVSFLGGNPRRIKQFVNLLELRLRLVRQRIGSSRLGAHRADVLAVAELLLLEARWPDRMAELQRDPLILSEQWRRVATAYNEPSDGEDDVDWMAYLRSLRRLPKVAIDDYILLCEPKLARGLDRIDDFVDALEGDRVDEVRAIIESAGPAAQSYAALATPRFRARLRERRWGKAHSILAGTLAVEELAGEDDVVAADLLSDAVAWRDLWWMLQHDPPDALLRVAERLTEEERGRVVSAVLERFDGKEPEDQRMRRERSEALSRRRHVLTIEEWGRVARMLEADHVAVDPESWAPLVGTCAAPVPTVDNRQH